MYPHLFIILSWNLFARSHSVASLLYIHFEWQEDSLIVTVPTHKGDQEGSRIFPVHVYANPLNPELCPVLALAIYVFSMTFHRGDEQGNEWKLFAGSSCEGKFSNWLHSCLQDQNSPIDANELGGSVDEIGTHSFRYVNNIYIQQFYHDFTI